MSDAPDHLPPPAKGSDAHPLDALTGGAFSAPTPGERAARLREWLLTQPAESQLQDVHRELGARDKGAARIVRERLDEIRRTREQEGIATQWAERAQALLDAPTLRTQDATAWQRDAARAGAPLSREPLAGLRARLAERVKTIEDLQHRVQVQREAAVLLAQRIEVLSTKPLSDAGQAREALGSDVAHWQAQAQALCADACWASVEERYPPLLESSRTQLQQVWEAFSLALDAAQSAIADAQAPLPAVPAWADEIRVARGLPPENPVAPAPAAHALARTAETRERPRAADAAQRQQAAAAAIEPALKVLADAPAAARQGAIAKLRAALRQHGRWVDAALGQRIHEQLTAAGDALGWQPERADELRQQLLERAQSLLTPAEGRSAPTGRKLQDALRQLREQWKQMDQGMPPNQTLWKKFDDACNAAHQQVQAWLQQLHGDAARHKATRQALIEELRVWTAQQAQQGSQDWKSAMQSLRQFGNRWREGGHVAEKAFADLQSAWKEAFAAAQAPLRQAQQASVERRQALIAQARELAAADTLRMDAVRALQQRWQAEAQSVALDRRQDQKLWDAFRQPIDEAFARQGPASARGERHSAAHAQPASPHERAVLDAARALQAATTDGDASAIRAAMSALESALQHPPADSTAARAQVPSAETATSADATADAVADAATPAAAEAAPAAAAPAAPRPVVAVRGDDRPGAKKPAPRADTTAAARGPRRPQRGDERHAGAPRAAVRPRLGDAVFRAQRDAMDAAQHALRKLAAKAHGEALSQLVHAWASRDAQELPSLQELGPRVNAAARNAWAQALGQTATAGDAHEALLRLEIAADIPSPAQHQSARRMLQLQLLTRRNASDLQQSWSQDVATVLGSSHDEAQARRLQNVLKPLLRPAR